MPIHKILMTAAIIATVSFATPWSPQAAEPGAPMARGLGFQRITLLVSDIDKSVDFYQRAGLLKGSDISTTDADQAGVYGAADLPLTADSRQSRHVIMVGPDGQGTLALLWYDRPPLPSARGNLVGIGIGDVVIGIDVTNIETAYDRLEQIGTRFQRTPEPFTQFSANGAQQTGQHLLAYDPDGHLVEVSQMDRR